MNRKPLFFPSIAMVLLLLTIPGCKESQPETAQPSRTSGKPAMATAPSVRTIGQPAPDFVLQDTKGKTWHLSELKGKVVFVNFWATWCPPCRSEMPSMQELFQSLPAKDFQMLAILSNDQPELAEKLATQIGFAAPILLDPTNGTAKAYGITGVPETYIVDKEGILREAVIGPLSWTSPEARQMLAFYMSGAR